MDIDPKVRNSAIGLPVTCVIILIAFLFLPGRSIAQAAPELPAPTKDSGTAPANSQSQAQIPEAPTPQTTPQTPAPQVQTPQIRKSKESGKYSATATSGSPGHIYWVIPAYKVNYAGRYKPLTSHEKFQVWFEGSYDPLGLAAGAVEAGTLEYSSKDGFCGYGHGWDGYGKCFGSLELDANVSSFIGDYALAVLWHQDPRYFRLGKGNFFERVGYSISRVFVTYNDAGHTVFYSSALAGTAIASGVSNLYYPQQDRGLSPSMSRIALDLGNTALYNAAAEFWPDINHGLHRIF